MPLVTMSWKALMPSASMRLRSFSCSSRCRMKRYCSASWRCVSLVSIDACNFSGSLMLRNQKSWMTISEPGCSFAGIRLSITGPMFLKMSSSIARRLVE